MNFPATKCPKISVIIPVYNTEPFLPDCLDSIINQTLNDIEIICIDDGSTDSSAEVLSKYAREDERITVITQNNQGLGAARNNGIKAARGEYIQFVDSDDYIAPNTCENLYKKAHALELDMLLFRGTNFNNSTKKIMGNAYYELKYFPKDWDKEVFNGSDCSSFITRMAVSAPLTMFKRTFLSERRIYFPTNLYFEDNVFFVKAVTQAKKISKDNTLYYYRRIHAQSITQNWGRHFHDYLMIIELVLQYLLQSGIDSDIYERYRKSYLHVAKSRYENFTPEEQKRYAKALEELNHKYYENEKQKKGFHKIPYRFFASLWKIITRKTC